MHLSRCMSATFPSRRRRCPREEAQRPVQTQPHNQIKWCRLHGRPLGSSLYARNRRFVLTDDIPSDVKKMQFYYTGGSGAFNALTGLGSVNSKHYHWCDCQHRLGRRDPPDVLNTHSGAGPRRHPLKAPAPLFTYSALRFGCTDSLFCQLTCQLMAINVESRKEKWKRIVKYMWLATEVWLVQQ